MGTIRIPHNFIIPVVEGIGEIKPVISETYKCDKITACSVAQAKPESVLIYHS